MNSFVIPAHNEQGRLAATIAAVQESARELGQPFEVIVVDDASTDATAAIGREHGATVVSVNHRQIAATRNSGARAAKGERLFFVDADTTVSPRVLSAALKALDRGAAGGGAAAYFDDDVPLFAPILLLWCNFFMRLAGVTGGAFMFSTRDAFERVGGFDESLYGAEDAAFAWAIKREGSFVVLWRRVGTSGRRMRGISGLIRIATLLRMAVQPQMLRQRATVHGMWYDSDRTQDERMEATWLERGLNVGLLVLMLVIIAGPALMFVPWSYTPPDSWLGEARYAIAIFGCHVGLLLWPCLYFLVCILMRQKRFIEQVKLVVLIFLCIWFGWGAATEVYWFWLGVINSLTHAA